jgi:hypothetical protein
MDYGRWRQSDFNPLKRDLLNELIPYSQDACKKKDPSPSSWPSVDLPSSETSRFPTSPCIEQRHTNARFTMQVPQGFNRFPGGIVPSGVFFRISASSGVYRVSERPRSREEPIGPAFEPDGAPRLQEATSKSHRRNLERASYTQLFGK